MANPFKNNSLASGLFGFILGLTTFGGGQAIYDANSEPEVLYQTPNGLMAVVPQQQTNGVVEQPENKEQAEIKQEPQNNQNSWYNKPPYKGLTENPNGNVIVTKSGEKYHKSFSCSGLKKAKDPILVDRDDAINVGFGPCSKCY